MSENPISRVPPEIWYKISEKIHSSKELVNLAKAIPAFENAVYSKRVEWLCYQILPILITNIYCNTFNHFGKDFLNFRLVCKHWKFAVDNFLENNVVHYPASGDNVEWKLNKCHFGEIYYLSLVDSFFRPTRHTTMEKMLREATNHPGNPIVGRYATLFVPDESNREDVNLVEQFIQTFGRHLHFLELYFTAESDPIIFINTILRLLQNLPNLKGLAIHKTYCGLDNVRKHSLDYLNRELTNINRNTISNEDFRNGLPKLETLKLTINGLVSNLLKSIIINMFCSESLKSLTVVNFVNFEDIMFPCPNLLHLSLNVNHNEQLESVLAFNCPKLRKLDFGRVMCKNLNYKLLRKVLGKFKSSVNSLALALPDVLEIVNSGNRRKMTKIFTRLNQLQMLNIKTISLFGHCPPSLNFICGDDLRSLEYLNLYYINNDNSGQPLCYYPLPAAINAEITDVIKRLAPLWKDKQDCHKEIDMTKSNVWTVFPRLKGILIDDLRGPLNKNGWTYRRNNMQ